MGVSKLQYTLLAVIAEISYLYPLYYLLAIAFKTPPMDITSIWVSIVVAIFAVMINKVLDNKSMRILTKIIVNTLLGWSAVVWLVGFSEATSLFSLEAGWLNLLQKWNLVLLILWIWIRAMFLSKKTVNYSLAVSRFELGLALIFILFFIASLLVISIPNGMICLMLFFISSAGTLSTIRWKEEKVVSSWSGLGFTAVLLIPLALTVSLMLPFMNNLAGNIYRIATPVLIFVRDLFAQILVFLLKRGNFIQDKGTSSTTVNTSHTSVASPPSDMPSWVGYIFKILGWLVLIGIVIVIALVIIYLIKKLLLKLLKVEKVSPESVLQDESWISWVKSILINFRNYLKRITVLMLVFLLKRVNIFQAYDALLDWGDFRKYPREKQETPFEYCQRLSTHFPQQKIYLTEITDCYVACKYGNKKPDQENIKQVGISLRKLYLSNIYKK